MIDLQPFTTNDFNNFKSWIKSEEDLYQFAGKIFTYPIKDSELINYINDPDKKPFKIVLNKTGKTIGHCELNYENSSNRLSRILIGEKDLRGKGIGEKVVTKMVELFFQDPTVKEVNLNVFDWNKNAIKCYEKVGFKINPHKKSLITVNNTTWIKLNMILKRP